MSDPLRQALDQQRNAKRRQPAEPEPTPAPSPIVSQGAGRSRRSTADRRPSMTDCARLRWLLVLARSGDASAEREPVVVI